MVYINSYNLPEIDKKEVFRYCKSEENPALLALLDGCISEMADKLSNKVCFAKTTVKIHGDEIDLGFARVRSHSLAICLEGCCEVIVFAATVGAQIDRFIEKYSIASPSRAVMLQALGSERVEALCDAFCEEMAEFEDQRGNVLRPRFSPGYGDLPLELQRDIFAFLTPTSKIGITLNENCFMLPEKSVTAIIGVKKK